MTEPSKKLNQRDDDLKAELQITLILGAGSSVGFGLPLGDELRRRILNIENRQEGTASGLINPSLARDKEELLRFLLEFRHSGEFSIDSFLARRGDCYAEIGKKAIAAILLASENANLLFAEENTDPWQRYFLARIASQNKWEEVDFTNIKIISFNYDRSLEHFLLVSLQAKFGKSRDEVRDKLKELEIIHVYGTLGAPYPGDVGYIKYGVNLTPEIVESAARSLIVIPEGRDSDPSLIAARKLLSKSDVIIFLGFSFDSINIERINMTKTCHQLIGKPIMHRREIFASCFGMTPAQKLKLAKMLTQPPNQHLQVEKRFFDGTCLQTLTHTLALGWP